ncbi:MAG: gliding motility-associated C-terminal protein [Flaviaesturariibacter sp.]|nr:gliding motility-associated C-terminal protein [Flaviaesturariibacter sp.]
MYTSGTGETDYYGGFPVSCPNGSGHSIRLGNTDGGAQAEGVSYEFTIPAGQNEYALIYHYAVVFQDPRHQIFEQPRMQIEITNVSDNQTIDCSSFSFTPFGTVLPGFFLSPQGADTLQVWCKNWSAVSVNLNGLAGKTIKLFFKTADCTFRRHFGYAYIDVNTECSSEFTGATYCRDDTLVNVTAPYGYQNYSWFNATTNQTLGSQQTITFDPPPPSGMQIGVELVPYAGYGCLDTLYVRLIDTLKLKANAGLDKSYCSDPVLLGENPKPGMVYSWSPAGSLSASGIANPRASPSTNTQYVLTVRHDGGGCLSTDTVLVESFPIDTTLRMLGRDKYCVGFGDSAVLLVNPADSIQWFRNGQPIGGAHNTRFQVTGTGSYYALLYNEVGCVLSTVKKEIIVDRAAPGIRYPVHYAAVNVASQLSARKIGDTALWSPGFRLSNPSSYTPAFTGFADQQYMVALKTLTGCITIDTQLVKTLKDADIYVPSGFTPDGDGRNDVLRPVVAGMKTFRYFRVYNRWGELLYETAAPGAGWDGKLHGILQATQAVVWVAEAERADGSKYVKKGTAVLIR